MKTILIKTMFGFMVSLSLLLVSACSENNSLNQPDSHKKTSVIKTNDTNHVEPNWFTFPEPLFDGLAKKRTGFSVTKLVKKNKNTKLEIKEEYKAAQKKKVEVNIKVEFKKGTVVEDTYITMTFEPATGIVTFLPHMIFDKDAQLEVKYAGLDLDGLDEDGLDFLYLCPDGEYEKVDKKKVKVNVKKGEISLKHSKVPHYSRYGFVR